MAKNPFIGQLDRKISIIKLVKSQSDSGAATSTDEIVATPWSFMEEKGGDEDLDGKEMHRLERTYTIRYRSEIKNSGKDYQLDDDGTRYQINHIEEIGRKRFLKLKVSLDE